MPRSGSEDSIMTQWNDNTKPNFQNFKNIILPVYKEMLLGQTLPNLAWFERGEVSQTGTEVHPELQYFMGGIFWTVQWAKTPVGWFWPKENFATKCMSAVSVNVACRGPL